jgi:uncharacterized membrane protein
MSLTLLGVLVIVLGFAARLNPLLVVTAAAIVTGLAGGLDFIAVISAFGKAFNENRYVSVAWLILPAIGALERAGLQERARDLITRLKVMTTFRILLLYLLVRQITAALGLTALGGQAQMVRPLMAPMTQAAAETELGTLPEDLRERVRAQTAATDNIGLFFGEDIFIAIGSILLMRGFLQQNGILVEPLDLSVWAIPTAIAAFVIHAARLYVFERRLVKDTRT